MVISRLKNEEEHPSKPNSYDMKILQKALPSFFDKEGSFRLDKFNKMLVEENVSITKEGYGLSFLGKSYARLQSALPTTTVIAPDTTHNSSPENRNSDNIYIVGDNLDALNHLIDSYTNRIKCIYIDIILQRLIQFNYPKSCCA